MLKLNLILVAVAFCFGVFGGSILWNKPAAAPIAIPESEELSKLKKQLAEYSSQKKSVIKEFNCANGALSKETSVDEATAAKIAKESEEKSKKVEELVVIPVVKDNVKLSLNSKLQPGIEISPVDHYWLGYSRDFKVKEDIYQLSYSTRIF